MSAKGARDGDAARGAGDRVCAEPACTADVAAAGPAAVPAVSPADAGERGLLGTVSLSAGQASLRVHVWRRLRSLGAGDLQSSVCLLPDRAGVLRGGRRLRDRGPREGRGARVLRGAAEGGAAAGRGEAGEFRAGGGGDGPGPAGRLRAVE